MKIIFGLVLILSIVVVHGELGTLLSVSQIMKPSDCKIIYKLFEIHFYRLQTKLRKGSVFTRVILFTGGRAWWGVCIAGGNAWLEGHAWQGACVASEHGGVGGWLLKCTVRILLECILVNVVFT